MNWRFSKVQKWKNNSNSTAISSIHWNKDVLATHALWYFSGSLLVYGMKWLSWVSQMNGKI